MQTATAKLLLFGNYTKTNVLEQRKTRWLLNKNVKNRNLGICHLLKRPKNQIFHNFFINKKKKTLGEDDYLTEWIAHAHSSVKTHTHIQVANNPKGKQKVEF